VVNGGSERFGANLGYPYSKIGIGATIRVYQSFPTTLIDDMMEFTKYFWGCRCGYFSSSHAMHGKPAWVKILRTPITFLGRWALMGFFETRGYRIKIGWFLLAK